MMLLYVLIILPLVILLFFVLIKSKMANGIYFISLYLPTLLITQAYFLFSNSNSEFYYALGGVSKIDFISLYTFNTLFYLFLFLFYFLAKAYLGCSEIRREAGDRFLISINYGVYRNLAYVFLLAGFSNFIFNVYLVSGLDLVEYFSTMAIRTKQFDGGGTTIFYLFSFLSGYIFTIGFATNRQSKITFILIMFIILVMLISRGRVTNTLSYIISLLVVYFKFSVRFKPKKILLTMFFLFFAILGLYFYRVYTSFTLNGLEVDFSDSLSLISYYLFDKGNTPNILVELFIFRNYLDISNSPMYGVSIFSSMLKLFGISGDLIIPSVYLKNLYYSSISGGALPPTLPGEAIINFGIFGVIIMPLIMGLIIFFCDHRLQRTHSLIELIVLSNIIGYFIFGSPKGEFDNFPIQLIIIYFIIFIMVKVLVGVHIMIAENKAFNKSIR